MTDKYIATFQRRAYDKDVDEGRTDRSFDAIDTKGRRFGAMVRKFTCEFVNYPAELLDIEYNRRNDGTRAPYCTGFRYYGFACHATRGGATYGALQRDRYFSTAADRDAAVEKYFAVAERGALKNKARAK